MTTAAVSRSTSNWVSAAAIAITSVVLLLLAYFGTTASTVAIWERSETFTHGYFIFPISAYLIWRNRHHIAQVTPTPDMRGMVLLALLGLGWLAAEQARVLVVQQLALVAMIPALVITVLGWRVAWAMAFPLGFLLLAVPMGEVLIQPLQYFTADFAVTALELTGIPVIREGTFFSIPSGDWSVVETCSGIRYLIASFTVGSLYAYLTYRSLHRRLLFMLASLVVPVIANGMRAYMIVMIAHLSDMKLALGVDHYIYGWVFFGIVMLLMFWVGSFWREDENTTDTTTGPVMATGSPGNAMRSMLPTALIALIVAAAWPGYAAYVEGRAPHGFTIQLPMPQPASGWEAAQPFTDWQPDYKGTDARIAQTYRKGDKTVTVFLAYYRYQRQGSELINSQNVMIPQQDPVWSNVGESVRSAELDGRQADVIQTKLRSPDLRLLIWHWNWLNGPTTVNPYWAKLHEGWSRLRGRWEDAAAIIVYTPQVGSPEEAADVLQEFLRDMQPALAATLEKAAET